jgi:hypothetical protein
MSATDDIDTFLTTKVNMDRDTATKVADKLKEEGIASTRLFCKKVKAGTLDLNAMLVVSRLMDVDYVDIIQEEVASYGREREKAVAGPGQPSAAQLQQKADLEAAIKATKEYETAMRQDNIANLASARTTLNDALAKIAPTENWRMEELTVEKKDEMMGIVSALRKNLDNYKVDISWGSYSSDAELLNRISGGALRKASIFLPTETHFATKASKPIFFHSDGAEFTRVAFNEERDETFSQTNVFSTYLNRMNQDGSTTSVSVQAGAFFGCGQMSASASHSSTSASEDHSIVNKHTLTTEACNVRSVLVALGEYQFDKTMVVLSKEAKEDIAIVHDFQSAKIFLEDYGTHFVTATQRLGGLQRLECLAKFRKQEDESTYSRVLSTEMTTSASMSGFGISSGFIGSLSGAGSGTSRSLEGQAHGTFDESLSEETKVRIFFKGPSCSSVPIFTTALFNNSKSWHFIDNGLDFSSFDGASRVTTSVLPLWDVLRDKGYQEQAHHIREAWLTLVIHSPVIRDKHGFFSVLVERTLSRDWSGDAFDWRGIFDLMIKESRSMVQVINRVDEVTNWDKVIEYMWIIYLDRHPVNTSHGLTHFHMQRDNDHIRYLYTKVRLSFRGTELTVSNSETHHTEWNVSAGGGCRTLCSHTVRVATGRLLVSFRLLCDGGRIRYEYHSAELSLNGYNFRYKETDVVEQWTSWEEGAYLPLYYLDRQSIGHGESSDIIVGFNLETKEDKFIRYKYWVVPASAFEPVQVEAV